MTMEIRWVTLIENIRAGVCIPFLGSGACLPRIPTGEELATELFRRAKVPGPYPFGPASNLSRVAQYVAALSGDSHVTKRIVEDILRERSRAPGDPIPRTHRILASLRLPIYITTNYDTLLEDALRMVGGVEPVTEICRWSEELLESRASRFDTQDYQPTAESPVVFHLHGAIGAGPESIVVTEDDYLDFLFNISREFSESPKVVGARLGLPLLLRRAIRNKPLLFVGYSLTDVNFRFILRALVSKVEAHGRVRSVAVQLNPTNLPLTDDMDDYRRRFEEYFKWTHENIGVLWGNADALCDRLEAELLPRATHAAGL
jgi:hypothetical protein